MLEKVSEHLEGTDEKVNNLEWICYYEDVDQLRQLRHAFSAVPNRPREKDTSLRFANLPPPIALGWHPPVTGRDRPFDPSP